MIDLSMITTVLMYFAMAIAGLVVGIGGTILLSRPNGTSTPAPTTYTNSTTAQQYPANALHVLALKLLEEKVSDPMGDLVHKLIDKKFGVQATTTTKTETVATPATPPVKAP